MYSLLKIEFEYRIFISLFIAVSVYICSLLFTADQPSLIILIGTTASLSAAKAHMTGYLVIAFCMLCISKLRMCSGSILTSPTVMSFKIQSAALHTSGPYQLVRNPIYLSDLLAMSCFALCMTWIGIFLPVLFYLHYNRLIRYEELSFEQTDIPGYKAYRDQTPRLIPTLNSFRRFRSSVISIQISRDGFLHNALYLLFVPGFLIGAWLDSFIYVLVCGTPAVLHWAIVHTQIGTRKNPAHQTPVVSPSTKKLFSDIIYAQCWEDPESDRAAFQIQKDDVIFSITSGGCNVLSFLADDPRKIIALDLNPAQSFLLDLKMAAFRELEYEQLLAFVGVWNASNRQETYQQLRPHLAPASRAFWDAHIEKIRVGIIHSGRYEKYMGLLRKLLRVLIGKSVIAQIFTITDNQERANLYDRRWNNKRWKMFTRLLLSRRMMSLFFDKSFFTYLDRSFSFGDHFAGKTARAIKLLPVQKNYFLAYILLGKYPGESALPLYLRKENYPLIRSRLDRIHLVTGNCQDFFQSLADNQISKFNFSNIFEWMSETDCESLLRQTIRVARSGAILTYRNLLVPRRHPRVLDKSIRSLNKEAAAIFKNDLSFIYDTFVVEQIMKEERSWVIPSKLFQTENA